MTPKQKLAFEKYLKTGIYFVTCIEPCLKRVKHKTWPNKGKLYTTLWYGGKRPTNSRCWGWYKKLKEAIIAVKENHNDIHEDEFSYAVIEKIPMGTVSIGTKEIQWFVWEGPRCPSPREGKYVECDKPKWSEGICDWSI